jgi:hypothetical protein
MKNPWDKYPIVNSASLKGGNPWDKYPVTNTSPQKQEENPLLSARGAARTAKSIGSGAAGGAVDTVTLPYNVAATMFNALKNSEFSKNLDPASRAMLEAEGFSVGEPGHPDIPLVPSAVEAIDKGVDKLTNDYTKTPENEKSFHEGLKGAASMGSVGGIAKGLVKFGANKVGNALGKFGSTKIRDIAAGGFASGVTDYALEKGHSLPAAFGEGIGAGIGALTLADFIRNPKQQTKNFVKFAAKPVLFAGGLGKKNFKTDVYEKLQAIGAEPTAAALSDSPTTAQLHQLGSHFPRTGEKIIEKNRAISETIVKGLDELADKVGKTGDHTEQINTLYSNAMAVLPDNETLTPKNLLAKAKKLLEKESKLATPNKKLIEQLEGIIKKFPNEQSETDILKSFLKNNPGFEKTLENPQMRAKIIEEYRKITPQSAPSMETLIMQKERFNSAIDWEGADPERKLLAKALRKDISSYKNSEFQQKYREAEKLVTQVSERSKFEDILRKAITDPVTQQPNHVSLTKLVLGHGDAREKLQKIKGLDFKKLEQFVEASRAMAQAQRNIKNPSGSGPFLTVFKFIASLAEDSISTVVNKGVSFVGLDQLLTNKRFLNLGYRFAKEPSEPLAQKINTIIKENTGMTAQTLVTGLKNKDNESNQKNK